MCASAYFNSFGRALTKEERAIWAELDILVKYKLREKKAECFYIKRSHLKNIWSRKH